MSTSTPLLSMLDALVSHPHVDPAFRETLKPQTTIYEIIKDADTCEDCGRNPKQYACLKGECE